MGIVRHGYLCFSSQSCMSFSVSHRESILSLQTSCFPIHGCAGNLGSNSSPTGVALTSCVTQFPWAPILASLWRKLTGRFPQAPILTPGGREGATPLLQRTISPPGQDSADISVVHHSKSWPGPLLCSTSTPPLVCLVSLRLLTWPWTPGIPDIFHIDTTK